VTRRLRWAVAAALALVAPVGSAVAAQAAPRADAYLGAVAITVTRLSPLAPGPRDTLVVAGSVTNTSSSALGAVAVVLHLDPYPVTSRSALAADAVADPPSYVTVASVNVGQLAPSARAAFRLSVPVAQLGLGPAGVYPLDVAVDAVTPEGAFERVGTAYSFLPWEHGADGSSLPPVGVTTLLPLLAPPGLDVAGEPTADLAAAVSPNGRLARLLAAVPSSASVTWVVDGGLLQAAGILSSSKSPGAAAAATWLAGVRQATAAADTWSVGYADPDLVAVHRAGLTGDLVRSATLGRSLAGQLLPAAGPSPGTGTARTLAWPAGDVVDAGTLRTLPATGARAVVLAGSEVPPTAAVTPTPDAVGFVAGSPLPVLASDTTLSALLATPPSQLGGPVLAAQRLLAEVAMVSAEAPDIPRRLLLVPPRTFDPEPGYLARVLSDLSSAPWARPTTVSTLVAAAGATAAAGPSALATARRTLSPYPAAALAAELPRSQLATVAAGESALSAVAAVVVGGRPMVDARFGALLRAESAQWRDTSPVGATSVVAASPSPAASPGATGSPTPTTTSTPTPTGSPGGPGASATATPTLAAAAAPAASLGQDYATAATAAVYAVQAGVHIVAAGPVVLASGSGAIPITVANDLAYPVTVRVALSAYPPQRMAVTQPRALLVASHRQASLQVSAQAKANGTVQVSVQLLTPTGAPYSAPVSFPVRATGYGRVAAAVVAAALALLAAALVVRVARVIAHGRRRTT